MPPPYGGGSMITYIQATAGSWRSWPLIICRRGQSMFWPLKMSHYFIQYCCSINLQVSYHLGRKTCVKMEGKTNFSRSLKQFDGLTWLTLTLTPYFTAVFYFTPYFATEQLHLLLVLTYSNLTIIGLPPALNIAQGLCILYVCKYAKAIVWTNVVSGQLDEDNRLRGGSIPLAM